MFRDCRYLIFKNSNSTTIKISIGFLHLDCLAGNIQQHLIAGKKYE